jgi:hypothetical protein
MSPRPQASIQVVGDSPAALWKVSVIDFVSMDLLYGEESDSGAEPRTKSSPRAWLPAMEDWDHEAERPGDWLQTRPKMVI